MTPDPTRTAPHPDHTRSAVGDRPTGSEPADGTRTGGGVGDADTRPVGSGTAPVPDAPPGFVIEREVGRGGTGVVYLARQVGLNRPVALKLIQSGDAGSVLRFLAEAEAMAAVRHPNVAEVYQFGEHAGRPFLALEYCAGGDLTATLKAGKLPPAEAAELLLAIAEGVAAAHAVGIVHRDLKPHNVLLAVGTPKVTDFGLAKRDGGSDLTRTNAVLGTPAYMPPEQARGETKFAGPPADVWAVGVMLYEALTGRRPFAGADHWAILAAVQRGTFASPRAVASDIPRDLELVCLKCLKPEPHERYPTAKELASDLRNWLAGKPISAHPTGVIEQAAKWAKRNKKLAGMGTAVLLTMALATATSLGFGLEANKQADRADKRQKDAEDRAEEVEREKGKVTTALNDLIAANEKKNRTLAKALLAPMSALRLSLFTEYEREALWSIAAERPGAVPLLLLEVATGSKLAAAQFRSRAEYLDHAAVGLDSRKRREADDLYDSRLRDESLPAEVRRDVLLAALSAERIASPDVLTEALGKAGLLEREPLARGLVAAAQRLPAEQAAKVLMAALEKSASPHERERLAEGLAAVAERLPANRAAEVLLAALAKVGDESMLAVALAAEAERLPADQRAAVCETAAKMLAESFEKAPDPRSYQPLAVGLAVIAQHLPAAEAAKVCRLAVDKLIAALDKTPDFQFEGRGGLADGLRRVALRLPAEEGAELLAKRLVKNPSERVDVFEQRMLAFGLAEAAGRLTAERAAEVCGKPADILAARLASYNFFNREIVVDGLSAVVQWLPAETGAEVLAAGLTKAVTNDTPKEPQATPPELRAWASGLARVATRLPAEKRAETCKKAADQLLAALDKLRLGYGMGDVARGLAWIADLLPAEKRADVCRRAAALLAAGLVKEKIPYSRGQWADGLMAVADLLPADERAELYGQAVEVFIAAMTTPKAESERTTASSVAALAERVPAEKGFELLTAALPRAMDLTAPPELAKGLAGVACGLPSASLEERKRPEAFAAVAGLPLLHPDLLPKPHPLPPQQLVELLKHPLVVKELRRAVLDALEFTYDRPFADLWAFVAFAEAEHPELDLLTPPKRPEKK